MTDMTLDEFIGWLICAFCFGAATSFLLFAVRLP